MTVAFRQGEDWTIADGAPVGVRFDVTVPSASKPGKTYRIVRQEPSPGVDGYMIHTPACPAWRAGRRFCGHVNRALETADDPLRRFALDVIEAWVFKGISLEDFRDYAAAMYQSAQQAIAQADELDRYEERGERNAARAARTPAQMRSDVDEAIAVFDRGPRGNAR